MSASANDHRQHAEAKAAHTWMKEQGAPTSYCEAVRTLLNDYAPLLHRWKLLVIELRHQKKENEILKGRLDYWHNRDAIRDERVKR